MHCAMGDWLPSGAVVKNSSANAGGTRDVGLIPGWGRSQTPSSNNTREDTIHGRHQMVNTEIRLIISLQPKMEKLYTVSKNKTRS